MMDNLNLLLELDADVLDFNIIGVVINDLAEPLDVLNNVERRNIPRNEGFYEVTIQTYMGDLFKEHFRMSRPVFQELFIVVGNEMIQRNEKVPLEKKLLFFIWVMSKPESFLAAGDRFDLARSTGHYVFKEMVEVINNLMVNYIAWPINYTRIERAFHDRYQIRGIVGAIDGCHIEIKQPTRNANDYYNRNSYHSIILQGICDNGMKFLNVYIGVPGRVHDARVFRNSPVFQQIHAMPINLHVLGDSAYPLSMNVMTPFLENGHLNEIQINYNLRHSSARAVIERAFGRLKGKFRRLKYLNISNPDFGCDIIAAACVLHNFILMKDGEDGEDFEPDVGHLDENEDPDENVDENMAAEKRMQIAENLM